MVTFNARLADSGEWKASLLSTNQAHQKMRRLLTTEEDVEYLRGRFGDTGVEAFMESGLAGMIGEKDVKCLHAQLADYLLRQDNAIGEAVATELEARGAPIGGCASCRQQCDVAEEEQLGGWQYASQKNKSKLRQTFQRRKAEKARGLGIPPPQPTSSL